jgi:glutamine synthetase adenylyltransferase
MDIAFDAITERAKTNAEAIPADITDMRQRLYREKPGKGLWDLKTAEGGLIDVEFVVQQDMLLGGRADAICASTQDAIQRSSFNIEERLLLERWLASPSGACSRYSASPSAPKRAPTSCRQACGTGSAGRLKPTRSVIWKLNYLPQNQGFTSWL